VEEKTDFVLGIVVIINADAYWAKRGMISQSDRGRQKDFVQFGIQIGNLLRRFFDVLKWLKAVALYPEI